MQDIPLTAAVLVTSRRRFRQLLVPERCFTFQFMRPHNLFPSNWQRSFTAPSRMLPSLAETRCDAIFLSFFIEMDSYEMVPMALLPDSLCIVNHVGSEPIDLELWISNLGCCNTAPHLINDEEIWTWFANRTNYNVMFLVHYSRF